MWLKRSMFVCVMVSDYCNIDGERIPIIGYSIAEVINVRILSA